MSKLKRFTAEQIVHKLREADVLIGQQRQGVEVVEQLHRLGLIDLFAAVSLPDDVGELRHDEIGAKSSALNTRMFTSVSALTV